MPATGLTAESGGQPELPEKGQALIIIVGTGKLARELLAELPALCASPVAAWPQPAPEKPAIVVHAGSGRELDEVMAYCRDTAAVLVELATGSALEQAPVAFPLVLCPNTNILMLKVMNMLATNGPHLRNYPVRISESHQAGKTSVPGTAVSMAQSLGVAASDIVSIRDPRVQEKELGMAPEHLGRHAYHRIEIADATTRVVLETRVLGDAPYAAGVAQIIAAIEARRLENRLYHINEFVEKSWL